MSKIFGARASVFMRYEGEIRGLSRILSNGLVLPDFIVEFRQDPPYDLNGSCEALGFELWLNTTTMLEGYNYLLEMETEISNDELSLNQMHDLSLWLGRFISKICDIDTCVIDSSNNLTFFNTKDH